MDVSVSYKKLSYSAIPTEHYETMKAIVQAVAEDNARVDAHGTATCMYCAGKEEFSGFVHTDDCLIIKARMLVSEWEKKP